MDAMHRLVSAVALVLIAAGTSACPFCDDEWECDDYVGECFHLRSSFRSMSDALGCDFTVDDYYCRQLGSSDTCLDPRVTECEEAIAAATSCPRLSAVDYCLLDCRSSDDLFDD